MPEITSAFEHRLVAALQPWRNLVLAHTLHQGMNSGTFAAIRDTPVPLDELSRRLNMNPERLGGFLQYLGNEGYVSVSAAGFTLTPAGREMEHFQPWYKLLVGGYGGTVAELEKCLAADAGYAGRSGVDVGIGSCGMSLYDALPLTVNLMSHIPAGVTTIVDLCCGSGESLADLVEAMPGTKAVGVDPEAGSIKVAMEMAEERGLQDRLQFHVGGMSDDLDLDLDPEGTCIITAFGLQELLGQQGRDAVLRLVRDVFKAYPAAYWAVIEVDNRAGDPGVMAHTLSQAYYNPYYLLHCFVEQRLETREFWIELFEEAGAELLTAQTTDPRVDSTGLEAGFLFRAKTRTTADD
ncbi:methyltransferase domain-containing protein [Sphaerisporangium sp. B11E5]|uniref:methyltransferase domain-containing protein n=1 Tax=Sphaerisporangium sp. B11E5 TaxID=3153563 RepID=UPI00325EE842